MAGTAKIGAHLAIDGEVEYKKALSNITAESKLLASEMKKVSSEFLDNADGIDALTKKQETMNKQVDNQTEKVNELRKALENAQKQYPENTKKIADWQTKLNNAETDLNKLNKEVKDNEKAMTDAVSPTQKLAKEIDDIGDEAKQSGGQVLKMGDLIKANLISDAIVGGVKLLGKAMVSVAKGAADMVVNMVESTSAISDSAEKTGIGAESLQQWQYAASQCGIESETLEKAMIKSQKSFADAKGGSDALTETYAQLGIDISKISSSDGAFNAAMTALAGMTDETKRNELANDLFGKSYAELAPLLNEGVDGIDALKQSASDLGLVMSEETVSAGEALGDTIATIKEQGQGLANTLLSELLPSLSGLATEGSEYIKEFSTAIQGANGDAGKIGEVIGGAMTDVINKIVEALPAIIEGAKSIVEALAGGIFDNLPTLLTTVFDLVIYIAMAILEQLPEIVKMGLELILSLANGIADNLPTLIETVVDVVLQIVDTILDNIDEIIEVALKIITALANGLIEALPKLADKIPDIIVKIVEVITDNLPLIVEAALDIVVALAGGLIKAIPKLVVKLPEIITAIVKGLASYYYKIFNVGKDLLTELKDGLLGNVADVGTDLVEGIWDGITGATDWLLDKIKGFASTVTDGIKDFFDIHSPSRKFRDEVGKNLALGLGEGFTGEMDNVTNKMKNSIPTEFDVNASVTGSTTSSSMYGAMASALNDVLVPALNALGLQVSITADKDGLFKMVQSKATIYTKSTGQPAF